MLKYKYIFLNKNIRKQANHGSMSNVERRKYCQLSSADGAPVHLTQRGIFVELSWKHAAAIDVRGEIFLKSTVRDKV